MSGRLDKPSAKGAYYARLRHKHSKKSRIPLTNDDSKELNVPVSRGEFDKFLQLPYEMRQLIWEMTFEPRFISLYLEMIMYKNNRPPPYLYLGEEIINNSTERNVVCLTYTSFLTVDDVQPVLGLSINQESREVALRNRYRSWKMMNREGKARNVMWDPKMDTVDFLNSDLPANYTMGGSMPRLLQVCEKNYPAETKEIKYLAVPTRFWPRRKHDYIEVVWPLIDFMSLKELAVVIDMNYEDRCAANISWDGTWMIPENLEDKLDALRAHYEKYGPEYHPLPKKPSVRVVMDKKGVLSGEDLHVNLGVGTMTGLPAAAMQPY